MTGIFPSSGVASAQTINGVASPSVIAGCDPRWYGIKCNVRIDVASMNAIISEILNAVNCAGSTYDCSRLDNLCKSIPLNVRENLCPTLTLTAAAETATILYCASDGEIKKGPIPAVPNICGAPNIGTITTQKVVVCNSGVLSLGDLPITASLDPCADADDVGTLPANASVLACIGGVLSQGLIPGGASGGRIIACAVQGFNSAIVINMTQPLGWVTTVVNAAKPHFIISWDGTGNTQIQAYEAGFTPGFPATSAGIVFELP